MIFRVLLCCLFAPSQYSGMGSSIPGAPDCQKIGGDKFITPEWNRVIYFPKIGGDKPLRPNMFYAFYILHSAGSTVQFHTYRVHQALLHVISVTLEIDFQAFRTWTEQNDTWYIRHLFNKAIVPAHTT